MTGRALWTAAAVVVIAAACSRGQPESPSDPAQTAAEAEPARGEADLEAAEGEPEAAPQSADPEASSGDLVDPDELEEAAVVFLEKVAAVGVEHIDDCDEVMAAWGGLADENEELLDAMHEHSRAQTVEQQAAFQEAYADRLDAFMNRMVQVIEACQDHPDLGSVLDRFATE